MYVSRRGIVRTLRPVPLRLRPYVQAALCHTGSPGAGRRKIPGILLTDSVQGWTFVLEYEHTDTSTVTAYIGGYEEMRCVNLLKKRD